MSLRKVRPATFRQEVSTLLNQSFCPRKFRHCWRGIIIPVADTLIRTERSKKYDRLRPP